MHKNRMAEYQILFYMLYFFCQEKYRDNFFSRSIAIFYYFCSTSPLGRDLDDFERGNRALAIPLEITPMALFLPTQVKEDAKHPHPSPRTVCSSLSSTRSLAEVSPARLLQKMFFDISYDSCASSRNLWFVTASEAFQIGGLSYMACCVVLTERETWVNIMKIIEKEEFHAKDLGSLAVGIYTR